MCGIFGLVATPNAGLSGASVRAVIRELFLLSESRGREAAGLATVNDRDIWVLKRPCPASELIESHSYKQLMADSLAGLERGGVAMIGHSRLVTNGSLALHDNNQPIISAGLVGVHNGIVANVDELWAQFPQLNRAYEVDTEIVLALIRHYKEAGQQEGSQGLVDAVRRSFAQLEGVANIALFLEESDDLVLATNNGSLYKTSSPDQSITVFASEEYILRKLLSTRKLRRKLPARKFSEIDRIKPGNGVLIGLTRRQRLGFSLNDEQEKVGQESPLRSARTITDQRGQTEQGRVHDRPQRAASPRYGTPDSVPEWLTDEYERRATQIDSLERCVRCVLPATYPFIQLDQDGVCIYCRNYKPFTFRGHEALVREVEPYRRSHGRPDCLVALSGGRDSCNSLHYISKELGMTPIAYTYDWGMVTDLARRNSSRICAGLGIEHVIVSANIEQKRKYIRQNVEAWLRKPDIGTVPLFMAGDKQFFWYAEQLKRKTGIDLMIFAMNPLERTDFKHGFCGISGGGHGGLFFRLNWAQNLQIAMYYAKAYAQNPAYLNSSLVDTVFAYFSYYVMPHKYTMFHDYIDWVEEDVERVLDLYNWERSPDTTSTWRIGDGTAAFYNYIYYMVTGFTENDTFRSEQIRAGTMTRDRALTCITDENRPRWQSIQWYCDTIGIDTERTLKIINGIPRLY